MIIKCPLCNNTKCQVKFVKELTYYYECSLCNFVFSKHEINKNFTVSIEDFEDAYLDYLAYDISDNKNHFSNKKWIETHTDLISKTVLDIGAGSGKWVRFLEKNKIAAKGLEPSNTLYKHFLIEDSMFYFETTSSFLKKNINEKFDIITCFDVLEHIEAPKEFLEDIYKLLNQDGYLFLSLPDAGSILSKILGKKWHHFNKYHMSFFNSKLLKITCNNIGFKDVSVSYHARFKSFGYIIKYFFNFVLGKNYTQRLTFLNNIFIPFNLFDTMFVTFKKNKK